MREASLERMEKKAARRAHREMGLSLALCCVPRQGPDGRKRVGPLPTTVTHHGDTWAKSGQGDPPRASLGPGARRTDGAYVLLSDFVAGEKHCPTVREISDDSADGTGGRRSLPWLTVRMMGGRESASKPALWESQLRNRRERERFCSAEDSILRSGGGGGRANGLTGQSESNPVE